MAEESAIEIYLRVKPSPRLIPDFEVDDDATGITFHNLRERTAQREEYVNHARDSAAFSFNHIFGPDVKQEEVFDRIGKQAVASLLEGYNATIFAYGQSGSGKTFTMTGGAEAYAQRGLIPRTIARVFEAVRGASDKEVSVMVSYMEIYNNDGYDLLSKSDSPRAQLKDLPRVLPFEDGNGQLVLRGLTHHRTDSEEDAFNILFVGDTNRIVCETPLNDASTRSHCIFTLHVEARLHGSELKTCSRLHLVDLSGSERVGRTGVRGQLLREACAINLSLHHLEHVIVCLQRKIRGEAVFVPFRNSLMTMVLKDSLGGNCLTRMVATVCLEEWALAESLSTCAFAQRVALVKNSAARNEAVDSRVLIARLRQENDDLRRQLDLLRTDQPASLTAEVVETCERLVEAFVRGGDGQELAVGQEPALVQKCFALLRERCRVPVIMPPAAVLPACPHCAEGAAQQTTEAAALTAELAELRRELSHKDAELRALAAAVSSCAPVQETKLSFEAPPAPLKNSFLDETREAIGASVVTVESGTGFTAEERQDPQRAFEAFKRNHRLSAVINEHLSLLRTQYDRGQALSLQVKAKQRAMDELKLQLECLRRAQLNAQLGQPYGGTPEPDGEQQAVFAQLGQLRREHAADFDELRRVKAEVDRLKLFVEKNKADLQRAFEHAFQPSPKSPALSAVEAMRRDAQEFLDYKTRADQAARRG